MWLIAKPIKQGRVLIKRICLIKTAWIIFKLVSQIQFNSIVEDWWWNYLNTPLSTVDLWTLLFLSNCFCCFWMKWIHDQIQIRGVFHQRGLESPDLGVILKLELAPTLSPAETGSIKWDQLAPVDANSSLTWWAAPWPCSQKPTLVEHRKHQNGTKTAAELFSSAEQTPIQQGERGGMAEYG